MGNKNSTRWKTTPSQEVIDIVLHNIFSGAPVKLYNKGTNLTKNQAFYIYLKQRKKYDAVNAVDLLFKISKTNGGHF